MLHIGSHLSAAKGYLAMGKDALSIGADTFQFFTRNPRGGRAKEMNPEDAAALNRLAKEHHFAPLIAHAPYTLNACGAEPRVREFAQEAMEDDLRRMEYFPNNYYNFHPGSHVGQGIEEGVRLISDLLNRLLRPEQSTLVLLETMSGKGSEVGGTFEELRAILNRVELGEKLGVCMDLCHVYSAGYDIVNDLDGVLERFDRVIGLPRLKAIHINDSLTPFASHKDRHARIGEGSIGLEALGRAVRHPALRDLSFCLETPTELEGHAEEIRILREQAERTAE